MPAQPTSRLRRARRRDDIDAQLLALFERDARKPVVALANTSALHGGAGQAGTA